MNIRPIRETEIAAVAAILRAASEEFIFNESATEAAAAFVRENDEAAIRGFILAGTAYFVAEIDGAVAGFIALRENKHIFHVFVDKRYHRRGIARAMFELVRREALAVGNPGLFTVNASNYAVPLYEKLGFVRTDGTLCKNGIEFNPMQLDGRERE